MRTRRTFQTFDLLTKAFIDGLDWGSSGRYARIVSDDNYSYLLADRREQVKSTCVVARFNINGSFFIPNTQTSYRDKGFHILWDAFKSYRGSEIPFPTHPSYSNNIRVDKRYKLKDSKLEDVWGIPLNLSPEIEPYLQYTWDIPERGRLNRYFISSPELIQRDLQEVRNHLNFETHELDVSNCVTKDYIVEPVKAYLSAEAQNIIWKKTYSLPKDDSPYISIPDHLRVYSIVPRDKRYRYYYNQQQLRFYTDGTTWHLADAEHEDWKDMDAESTILVKLLYQ